MPLKLWSLCAVRIGSARSEPCAGFLAADVRVAGGALDGAAPAGTDSRARREGFRLERARPCPDAAREPGRAFLPQAPELARDPTAGGRSGYRSARLLLG